MSGHIRQHADKTLTLRRVDEVIRLRLEGYEFWDLRKAVRAGEQTPGSVWCLREGEKPLSDSQIHRYRQKADEIIHQKSETDRDALIQRHIAQRRYLYKQCLAAGDRKTALAAIADEAEIEGIYAPRKVAPTDPSGKQPWQPLSEAEREDAIRAILRRRGLALPVGAGGDPATGNGHVPADGPLLDRPGLDPG